jgi:hypothetical protein
MEYARRAALAVLDRSIPRPRQRHRSRSPTAGIARASRDGRDRCDAHPGAATAAADFGCARHRAASNCQAKPSRPASSLLTDSDTNCRSDDHLDLIAALARDQDTIRIRIRHLAISSSSTISRETGGGFITWRTPPRSPSS